MSDDIKALEAKATPGPWEKRNIGYGHRPEVVRLPDGSPDDGGDIVATALDEHDAAFIAAARTAVPALLAERDALAAELADVRAELDYLDEARMAEADGALRAENERMRAALEEIASAPYAGTVCARIARAALNP